MIQKDIVLTVKQNILRYLMIDYLKTLFFKLYFYFLKSDNESFISHCTSGNTTVVKTLLFNEKNNSKFDYEQAFLFSCHKGQLEIIKLLFSFNKINFTDSNFDFFFRACISGNLELVDYLIHYGNFKDSDINVALFFAVKHGKFDILELLLNSRLVNSSFNINPVFINACYLNNVEAIKIFIKCNIYSYKFDYTKSINDDLYFLNFLYNDMPKEIDLFLIGINKTHLISKLKCNLFKIKMQSF